MAQEDKQNQYTIKLLSAIQGVFDQDNDNFIGMDELKESDNLTHFFHALANMAPNYVYNEITGDDLNNLDFNHVANKLVFQYAKKID